MFTKYEFKKIKKNYCELKLVVNINVRYYYCHWNVIMNLGSQSTEERTTQAKRRWGGRQRG